jgi:hypothetical protein
MLSAEDPPTLLFYALCRSLLGTPVEAILAQFQRICGYIEMNNRQGDAKAGFGDEGGK